jgi:hypothetical protein
LLTLTVRSVEPNISPIKIIAFIDSNKVKADSLLLLLLGLALLLSLLLQVPLLLLVALGDEDERVQGQHAAHHGADVDREEHVVVLGREGTHEVLAVEVGQQIDDLLQQEHHLVVGRQPALPHVPQVLHDFADLPLQPAQGLHLAQNAAVEGVQRDLLYLPQQVLHPDLLGLGGLDLGLDVEEGLEHRAGLLVDLLLRDEALRGQAELVLARARGTLCSTSTRRKMGLSLYLRKTSLIWMSWALKESPVVYHPMNFSF